MHYYQQFGTYFGQTAGGMEPLAAEELAELGATNIEIKQRGVLFKATKPVMYKVVYYTRLLTRVLATLTTFNCHNTDYLYNKALQLDWSEFIKRGQTFAILYHAANSKIQHSHFAALKLKDALVDQLRNTYGERPNIDRDDPDVWLHLAIHNNRATISIDCAGHSLNKRGYRQQSVAAPMQETLAAAIVRQSRWDEQSNFYDPFCGSGTILAEALMHYCKIPAGYLTPRFGFMQLPDFDQAIWKEVKAQVNPRPLPKGLIAGSDIDPRAVEAARQNLSQLPYGNQVAIKQIDFKNLPAMPGVTIVANPPYGVRLKNKNIELLYKDLGNWIREKCPGSSACVFSSDEDLLKSINLRPRTKKKLNNGGIDGHFYRMLVFDRSKKD